MNTLITESQAQVENESLRAQVKALQAKVEVTADLENQVKMLREQLDAANKTNASCIGTLADENRLLVAKINEAHDLRTKFQKELKNTASYMIELEERVYFSNSRSLELLKAVRDLEFECATLKNYIIELKARVAIYVPT